jgi:hypothetical protein
MRPLANLALKGILTFSVVHAGYNLGIKDLPEYAGHDKHLDQFNNFDDAKIISSSGSLIQQPKSTDSNNPLIKSFTGQPATEDDIKQGGLFQLHDGTKVVISVYDKVAQSNMTPEQVMVKFDARTTLKLNSDSIGYSDVIAMIENSSALKPVNSVITTEQQSVYFKPQKFEF